MDVFLGDILCPYERGQAPDISFKHTFMYRKVQSGSENGVFVIVIDDIRSWQCVGVDINLRLLVLLLLR